MEKRERPDKLMLERLVDNLLNSINVLNDEYSAGVYKKILEDYYYLKDNKKYLSLISKIKFNIIVERKIKSVLDLRQIEQPKEESTNAHKNFSSGLNPVNFSKVEEEEKFQTIVISDLHGDLKKWHIVKQYMQQNPKTNVIILGDAIDRGTDGIDILCDIKELSETWRIVYIPGNHDAFAYNALRSYGDERLEEIFDDDIQTWSSNGGETTKEQFLNLEQEKMHELIEWLGKQPIQYKITNGNKVYAIAHAIFDERLYQTDQYFNLEKAYTMKLNGFNENNYDLYRRYYNCLWYREGSYEPVNKEELLLGASDEIIVVGHTPQLGKVAEGTINNNRIICVDNSCYREGISGLILETGKSIDIGETLYKGR